MRPHYVLRVAIDGAESTGKTTLAERLAGELGTVWVPEYGRSYCERVPANELVLSDFDAIAWGQATWEEEYATRANRVLVCDTDLHTTATWSDLITGRRSEWLTAAARGRRYDLTLLLDADVPWVDDGTRVLGARRVEHTERLRAELEAAGRTFVTLGGSFGDREVAAVERVRALVGARGALRGFGVR